ncbi:methionine biosynthesis protein MetW [Moraxella ovis]|uniref:Methionine biosynthesis protein MetW n=1 Tax=Moraxella ovis TaxID=29433 RepID=A0A161I8R0_9GAMM|nr:methionine biosynthesis protein MetW [Moraxella ovis]ANB91864.1 methionine biosynthesis protein MetW [Moraxella ovis]SPX85719.1 methionine biosynthesis protein MetW [Moraxella ovis]STY87580.1 methionine biosynthesis protein MetW [Moraxella ovis]STZ05480.1 methionine biosynthesis protein MetW [Moraxella ovis]
MNNIDHQLAEKWIRPNARVLDLGCGDGTLLAHLKHRLGVSGYGLEIDPDKINQGITKGLNIIEQDLNDGLARFADGSFDTVVMARALQAVKNPQILLNEMLRVAKEGIVTFPNFAYWQNRVSLGIKGIMPMSETLPHQWYDTPNIHLCTFKDFERLCQDSGITILDTVAINDDANLPNKLMHKLVKYAPNLLADVAVYRITKSQETS